LALKFSFSTPFGLQLPQLRNSGYAAITSIRWLRQIEIHKIQFYIGHSDIMSNGHAKWDNPVLTNQYIEITKIKK